MRHKEGFRLWHFFPLRLRLFGCVIKIFPSAWMSRNFLRQQNRLLTENIIAWSFKPDGAMPFSEKKNAKRGKFHWICWFQFSFLSAALKWNLILLPCVLFSSVFHFFHFPRGSLNYCLGNLLEFAVFLPSLKCWYKLVSFFVPFRFEVKQSVLYMFCDPHRPFSSRKNSIFSSFSIIHENIWA